MLNLRPLSQNTTKATGISLTSSFHIVKALMCKPWRPSESEQTALHILSLDTSCKDEWVAEHPGHLFPVKE